MNPTIPFPSTPEHAPQVVQQMWNRNRWLVQEQVIHLLAETLNGSVGGCAVFGFRPGQASFF